MARIVLTLLFFLGFLGPVLSAGGAACAQSGDQAYTVTDVKVDTIAESAVKARDKAFGEAQVAAFKMLASRYLGPDEIKTFSPPDASVIAGLVQDFEVKSEQLSTKRYIGTYTFRFKAGAVNRYFGRGPQYYEQGAEESRSGLLVLPVFQYGPSAKPSTLLWDAAKNPWLKTWQAQGVASGLILPVGDVSDMMDVRDEQAMAYNPAGLRRMRVRYDAYDAVIALARFTQGASPPLTVEIYRTDRAKPELVKAIPVPVGKARVLSDLLTEAASLTKRELGGNWKQQASPVDETVDDSDDLAQDSSAEDDSKADTEQGESVNRANNPPPFYRPPLSQTVPSYPQGSAQGYQQGYPQSAQSRATPSAGQVRATARFSSLNEWLAIRKSLNGVPAMTGVRIVALKSNEAVLDLSFADWAAFTTGLRSRGLSLTGGGGAYQLSGGGGHR